MKYWTARLVFLVVLGLLAGRAQAQSKLTVDQLISFVKSSVQLHHDDRQIATFIKKNVSCPIVWTRVPSKNCKARVQDPKLWPR